MKHILLNVILVQKVPAVDYFILNNNEHFKLHHDTTECKNDEKH